MLIIEELQYSTGLTPSISGMLTVHQASVGVFVLTVGSWLPRRHLLSPFYPGSHTHVGSHPLIWVGLLLLRLTAVAIWGVWAGV